MNQMVANENDWRCFSDSTATQTSGLVLTDVACVLVCCWCFLLSPETKKRPLFSSHISLFHFLSFSSFPHIP